MMNQESRKAGKNLRNRELTDRIISAAIRVHRGLGPGFLENIYEEALAVITRAWTSDVPFTHHGKYWQFDEVIVEPPTAVRARALLRVGPPKMR